MPLPLKESPDKIRLDQVVSLAFDHPSAHTFCFPSRNTVATSRRPHTYLFNALARTINNPRQQQQIFRDYECRLYGRLDPDDLKQVATILADGSMGGRRIKTLAGRAWIRASHPELGKLHALSFWTSEDTLRKSAWVFPLLIDHFNLEGAPVYFEGIDSKQPRIYRGFMNDLENDAGGLHSTVDPSLTTEQIIEILVKAHTSSMSSLTAKEREVVYEFRGKTIPKQYQHLFPTTAEFNALRSTSESVAWRRPGLLGPPLVERLLSSVPPPSPERE